MAFVQQQSGYGDGRSVTYQWPECIPDVIHMTCVKTLMPCISSLQTEL